MPGAPDARSAATRYRARHARIGRASNQPTVLVDPTGQFGICAARLWGGSCDSQANRLVHGVAEAANSKADALWNHGATQFIADMSGLNDFVAALNDPNPGSVGVLLLNFIPPAKAKVLVKLADRIDAGDASIVARVTRNPSGGVDRQRVLVQNYNAGKAAEARLAARYPGSRREVTFNTGQGRRRIDVLTAGRTAIESKSGAAGLSARTRRQISKDVELKRTGVVRSVEWHFQRSARTGKVGPNRALRAALQKQGIKVVIHR